MTYVIPVRSEDFKNRSRRHLPRSNRTPIVLKGHLLMQVLFNASFLVVNPAIFWVLEVSGHIDHIWGRTHSRFSRKCFKQRCPLDRAPSGQA
jgi:hypothetical protein